MNVTIIHKLKQRRAYNLLCAIPLVGGKVTKDQAGFERVETEKVLTLGPGEVRTGLPAAVVESPEIQSAIARKEILVKEEKVVKKAGKKPVEVASDEPQREVKPQATSNKSKKD